MQAAEKLDRVVTAQGLRRSYGAGASRFEAVRGVDLEIGRGELFALLGTNGAGKTSTLEVLEGLAPPGSGTARVLGHDPFTDRRRIIGRVGLMLQESGFPEALTVAEVAQLWHGTISNPRPVATVLAEVDLADRAKVPVKSLSGGEKRRLDLGLAIMGRPEVLFLDEPTTGLDPQSRQLAWELVRSLVAGGTTVVLTTHYLQEAEALADRVAIMHSGRIAAEGTLAELAASQSAQIHFGSVPDDEPLTLAELPGLTTPPERNNGQVVLTTADLQLTLTVLLERAAAASLRLDGLTAQPATLEQAFMRIAQGPSEDPDDVRANPGGGPSHAH